jgi:exodeoxyribonuclease V
VDIKLTAQQNDALNKVRAWLKDPNGKQIFRLFGYAGTGKTTLALFIEEVAHELSKLVEPVVYATYTGKASLVLRQKGCENASTIHSLIYKPRFNERGDITGWYLDVVNSPIAKTFLVIVDEVSMVNQEQGEHLESFGKRILVLGDPFQLPPVSGEGYFTSAEPDVMLTDVRRQAKDNPIIYMATEVREERRLKYGRYGKSAVIRKATDEQYVRHSQTIVGLNRTRAHLNQHIRHLKGFPPSKLPTVDDRLICLRNERDLGLINGSMWKVKHIDRVDKNYVWLQLRSLDFHDAEGKRPVISTSFYGPQFRGELDYDQRMCKGHGRFDFGNAITCHKAQGSQWKSVLGHDESSVFAENADRWLYTLITRASLRVTIVR